MLELIIIILLINWLVRGIFSPHGFWHMGMHHHPPMGPWYGDHHGPHFGGPHGHDFGGPHGGFGGHGGGF